MAINLGPSHPAMHGTVRMAVGLEGEPIAQAVPEIDFLHRGFEKSCEASTWTQGLPYVDRLNYVFSAQAARARPRLPDSLGPGRRWSSAGCSPTW